MEPQSTETQPQPSASASRFAHWYSLAPGRTLTAAGEAGLVVGVLVGIGFMVALFTVLPKAPGHAEWSQAFLALPPVGAGCIVAAVVLGLLERVSSFFPSFALSSCYTIVLASLVSVIVFAVRWEGALIVLWAVYLVEIIIAVVVLRAIASRMARRRAG